MKTPEQSSWKYALALVASLVSSSDAPADIRHNAGVTEEHVDMIEYNNLYDENGDALLDQIVLWNWDIHDKAYRCCDFAVVGTPPPQPNKPGEKKDCKPSSEMNYPMKMPNGSYRTIVSKLGRTRVIYSNLMRETWTQFDPEVADQEHIQRHQRVKPAQTPYPVKSPEDFIYKK